MKPALERPLWHTQVRTRRFAAGDGAGAHGRVGAEWLAAAAAHLPLGGGHLDLGCGAGRMSFALAERWSPGGWSLGADRDPRALEEARAAAREKGLAGAEFVLLDVETEEYGAILKGRRPDLITAHLCMGPEIVERAARALPPAGTFAFVALHPDLWKETGRPSRFALGEEEVERLLRQNGLEAHFLRVEKDVLIFDSPEAALEEYLRDAPPRWHAQGRWDGLRRHFAAGGRTLTARAQIQAVTRKAAP